MAQDESKQYPSEEKDNRDQIRIQKVLSKRIKRLSQDLEKFNLAEYMNMLNDPRRYFKVNFMVGLARGLGFALGATVFAALVIYILQRLVVLNLPLIGDFIAELVWIVNQQIR